MKDFQNHANMYLLSPSLYLTVFVSWFYLSVIDAKALITTTTENTPCADSYPFWNSKDQSKVGVWERVETYLNTLCKRSQPSKFAQFVISGNIEMPSCCQAVNICNRTDCLVLGPRSHIYTFRRDPECVTEDLQLNHVVFSDLFTFKEDGQNVHEYFEKHYIDELLSIQDQPTSFLFPKTQMNWNMAADGKLLDSNTEQMARQCTSTCDENSRQLLIEGVGYLPSGCEEVNICNDTICAVFSKTAMLYSRLKTRTVSHINQLFAPPACTKTQVLRRKRAVLPISSDEKYKTVVWENGHKFYEGLLKFNLPGYRYVCMNLKICTYLINFNDLICTSLDIVDREQI